MTSSWSLVLAACLVLATCGWTEAAYGQGLYEDMLFQDLYKRLTNMDSSYYPVDEGSYGAGGAPYWDPIPVDARDNGQADIRDPEYLAHSSIGDGFQYISGGAGEGKQHLKPEGTLDNPQEVKSDDVLPFYCHPPNPCPKGFKAEDGCQENIKDDAEVQKDWISRMQNKGMCSCDEEHMFDCPGQGGMQGNGLQADSDLGDQELNDFINTIMGNEKQNPFGDGSKLKGVVSKKSPRIKRSIDIEKELNKLRMSKRPSNPYLQGNKIHIVAKKGVHMN